MKLKVLSKKVTIEKDGKEKTFFRYFSPCNIEVLDEKGESKGVQLKNIEVHFTKKASKKLDDEKVFAIIECAKPEDYQLPFVYQIKVDENTGEVHVPQIWIRDFETFTAIPYKAKQSTCEPVIEDETDTEETIIE